MAITISENHKSEMRKYVHVIRNYVKIIYIIMNM